MNKRIIWFSEDVSATDSIKKFKRGENGETGAQRFVFYWNKGQSQNLFGFLYLTLFFSVCDSGLGSASDSGRGKSEGSSEGSASETEKCPEEVENIKRLKSLVRKSEPITAAPIATIEVEVSS